MNRKLLEMVVKILKETDWAKATGGAVSPESLERDISILFDSRDGGDNSNQKLSNSEQIQEANRQGNSRTVRNGS